MVFTQAELNQLFRLSAMASHFAEHEAENPQLTLSDFLHLHYLDAVHSDEDADRDKELPFKKVSVSTVSPSVELPGNFTLVFFTPRIAEAPFPHYVNHGAVSGHTSDVWQPPRQL